MTPCAFDTETWLSYPGNQTPKIVCASWATFAPDGSFTPGRLVLREEGLDFLELLLDDPEVEICGAHIAYDFGCASAARPHLLKKIFAAYDANRVWDILLGEALFDIRQGCIFKDPITGAPFERYSQGMLEERLLGIDRSEAKHGVNAWRLRYCELEGVPLDQWPPAAVEYPKDDAVNALAIAKIQKARVDANGHCMGEQASAAFALHLSACWGIRTDPKIVAEVVAEVTAGHHAAVARFAAVGLYRADGTKDSALLAKMVARAYGAKDPCPKCNATGKVPSPKTKKPINCSDCDGTGLDIGPCPQTPKGAVKCDRDVLKESGDETLVDFAKTGENEKWFSTYIPIITQGTEAPINAEVNALVATGRVSYRKPNLTNQPRNGKIRECYTARDGRWLFTVDFGGIELVTLAQTCIWYTGGSAMADALNAGQDLHDRFAASVRNITYEVQHAARLSGDKVAKNFRQMGKCFHPDTEILTRAGWKKIGHLSMGDQVAAAIPEDGAGVRLEWQTPTALTGRPCPDGKLLHLKNEGMDLRVTEDHRMLVRRSNGKYAVVKPREVSAAREWMNAGVMEGLPVVVDERLLRLAVAVQADGSYTGQKIRLGFSKQRKIDRLRGLLLDGEYETAEYTNGKVEKLTTSFVLTRELSAKLKALLDDKRLPWWWTRLSKKCREVVLDEFHFWDGSERGNWRMTKYYSTIPQNIDVMQALASMTGRKSRAVWDHDKVNPEHAACCHLTVRAPGRDCTRGENLEVTEVPYDGYVVCLSVPASFVLVRDGGIPVITGQCANFGYPGGLGGDKFVSYARQSYGAKLCELAGVAPVCGVSKERDRDGKPICAKCRVVAADLRKEWFRTWPEVRKYHECIKDLVEDRPHGGSVTVLGKDNVGLGITRGGVYFCDGANTGFQGLAARGAKRAFYRVTKECYTDRASPLFGSRPLIMIHDEILGESPVGERSHFAAYRVSRIMIDTMREYTPDVRVTAPPALMSRWFKGAEPVHQCPEHGKSKPEAPMCCDKARLIPWEPVAKP